MVFHDGAAYWLGDGFHRVTGARGADVAEIEADVRQGTRRDAVLFSVGANATHGLKRTNADKRRAVETLLRDEEWRAWSDNEIARRAGVSPTFAGKVRGEVAPLSTVDSAPRLTADGRVMNTANIGKREPKPEPKPRPEPNLFDGGDEDDDDLPDVQRAPAANFSGAFFPRDRRGADVGSFGEAGAFGVRMVRDGLAGFWCCLL